MTSKKILRGSKARQAAMAGFNTLADTVKVTLGPKGRNAAIEQSFGSPTCTKDGVTVAKAVELKDKFQNIGVQILKSAASKTADVAGDGTTTATVLAQAICKSGFKLVEAGANPMDIRRGIEKAIKAAVENIKSQSTQIKSEQEIAQVGTISANNDEEIGKLIANAMQKVGKEGVLTVEESKNLDSDVDVVEGMSFDRGLISHYFVTNNEKMSTELEKPLVLLFDKKISSIQSMLPILQKVAEKQRSLLIIAEDVDGEALTTLIVNKLRGGLKVAAVKAPGFGDRRKAMMEDIAILTGGQLITEDLGMNLDKVEIEAMGSADKITIDKDNTTIVNGAGKKSDIQARCDQLRKQIKDTTSDYDKEKLQERLAKLSGGVAVLKVGGATEAEVKERKDRVDDALHATRAAVEEGIVPGGGITLLKAANALSDVKGDNPDQNLGIEIVREALSVPLRTIVDNAGLSGEVVISKIRENNSKYYGFNAQSEEYGDMIKFGIIDPTKVVRSALQNAGSAASLLITTDVLIVEDQEDKQNDAAAAAQAGAMGGMGGMGGMGF